MRVPRVVLASGVALAFMAGSVNAQTIVVDPGTTYATAALTGFATTGNMMNGMTVRGYSSSGSFVDGIFGALGGGYYGVQNSLFTLSIYQSTDTYLGSWSLTANSSTNALTGFVLNGAPGQTVFDRTWPATSADPFGYGTDGSARGTDFVIGSAPSGFVVGNVTATYRNYVAVGGNTPVGDLFEQLAVQFNQDLAAGATFTFDTDNAISTSPLTPVPEPGTLALLMIGLVGVGAGAARKRS